MTLGSGAMVDADTPQLMAEAANFDRISGELGAVLGQVESTGAALATDLQGEGAGPAVQAALARFSEASRQQTTLLTEISQNIHTSGQQYDTTDAQNAETLAGQMLQGIQ